MTKKIILDTNFLLIPGQFMVDIFSEIDRLMNEPYHLIVLDKTINELHKIAQGDSKDARAAKLALALIETKKADNPTLWEKILGLKEGKALKIVRASKGYVDDAIVSFADDDTIVATQDAALKRRLKTSVITLKQKKYLTMG